MCMHFPFSFLFTSHAFILQDFFDTLQHIMHLLTTIGNQAQEETSFKRFGHVPSQRQSRRYHIRSPYSHFQSSNNLNQESVDEQDSAKSEKQVDISAAACQEKEIFVDAKDKERCWVISGRCSHCNSERQP
jgi:hypothetical protein